MPNYSYRAKNLKGEEETGVLEAKDPSHLARLLRQKGYYLMSVEGEEAKEKKRGFRIGQLNILERLRGVSLSEKLFFTKNLGVMIKTGVPLPRAFEILSNLAKSKKFKEALKKVSERITKGESLSDSLSYFPDIFPQIYQETLKVGEETGKLEDSLDVLAQQIDREHNLKSKLTTAMVYPIVVLVMAFLIGILMFIFAIPKLKTAFEELGVKLPFTTTVILNLGDFLAKKWPIAILIVLSLIFILSIALRSRKGGKFKSKLVLIVPLISKISRQMNSTLILRTLSSVLSAGVPIVRALEVTSGSLKNFYFKKSLKEAAEVVEKGKKLSEALEPYKELYLPMVLEMIKVGEETGETPQVLGKLADFYEEELSATLQKLSSLIEPLLIIFIGGVVGFFAVSMMQPLFSIMGGM